MPPTSELKNEIEQIKARNRRVEAAPSFSKNAG